MKKETSLGDDWDLCCNWVIEDGVVNHEYQACFNGLSSIIGSMWPGTACIYEVEAAFPRSLFIPRREYVWMYCGLFNDPAKEFMEEVLDVVLPACNDDDIHWIKRAMIGKKGSNITMELHSDEDMKTTVTIVPLENG